MINPTKINQQSSLFFQEGRVKSSWILAAILLLGLALRILLLSMRWINPDEGAHLLDARLLLEGQVPVVDYGSRQPFYVLMIALFLKIFGVNYTAGRLLPLFSSLGVGWMLFLFGRRWKDDVVGLTAAGIYAFLPLVIVWSTIVKTEQLTILLGVISIYLLVVSANDKAWPLFLSGLFAGLAFYVRQPALYLPLAAVVFLAWRRRNVLKSLALYVGGYLVVCLAVAALYLPHMSFQDMLFSQLNPLNLIWNRFLHLFGLLPEQYRIVDEEGFRFLGQSMDYTLTAWHHSLSLCLFIILGALVMLRHKQAKRKEAEIQNLLVLWSGFCFLLYLYQTASRGFYTQYFTEALPALILLAAAAMKKMFADLKKKGMTIALGAPLLFVLLFLGQKIFPTLRPGMAGYFVLGLGLAALLEMLLNTSPADLRSIFWLLILLVLVGVSTVLLKKLGLHDLYRFVLVLAVAWSALYVLNLNAAIRLSPNRVLLLTGFVFTALQSGLILGPRYEGIWSGRTTAQVVNLLHKRGQAADDVLSGGTIWTFESGFRPYLNVPHPTEFLKHRYAGFEETLRINPPQFIILDGYTHRKFAKHWSFIKEYMEINYTRVARFEGSKYPVDIFQVTPSARQQSGFVAHGGETP